MKRITKGSLVTIDFYSKKGSAEDYWLAVEKNDFKEWRVVHLATGYERWVNRGWLHPVKEK